jgi:hypothetical protein
MSIFTNIFTNIKPLLINILIVIITMFIFHIINLLLNKSFSLKNLISAEWTISLLGFIVGIIVGYYILPYIAKFINIFSLPSAASMLIINLINILIILLIKDLIFSFYSGKNIFKFNWFYRILIILLLEIIYLSILIPVIHSCTNDITLVSMPICQLIKFMVVRYLFIFLDV